ncbi:MAG: WD40 repeat domain-containing protein [Verrucomicrobia bacterium]|nr:WD40 repeat domain-containing protein [Verrucomicrobiota bacterium]
MLAHQAWEEGNLGRARALLEATRPTSVEDDPRGFEWRHVWHLCHHPQCRRTITNAPGGVMAAGFWSEDQLWLAGTHELRLADLEGQAQQALLTEPAGIQWLSHSPVATNLWALVTPRHEIKLWDLSSRRCLASFTNHVGSIRALAFSPDGQWLASAGDETVWLQPLNAPERRPRLVARYPTDATGVAFSRDSQHLFTCGRHPAIHLWNLANPSLPGATLQRHTAHLYCVVVSPDGSRLASAGADGRIVVWDSLSRRPLHEFMGRHGRVSTLAFSPDGCWVVSGSRDQTLRVWDLAQNRPFLVLRGHEREVTSVAFAPDSRTLVSTDGAGVAKVWDLTTTASASDLGRHPSWVDSLAFSPDGRRLASAGYIDPVIKLWEVDPRRELATFRGHPEPIHRVRFSRDGQLVATGGHEGTVRLWRAGQTEPVAILTNDFPVFALDFSTNGRVLATGGGRIFGHANARPGLVLWELESLRPAQLPAGIPDAVEEVVFDPHGRYLAAGFADGTVGLWEAATGRFLRRWQPHQSVVLCVAFSPDGRWLASGSADTTIVLSDADHPERRFHRLRGHTDWVYSLAFAPDERTLASLALGGTLKLWSLATHEVVLTLTAPGGVLTSLAFSPQNNLLATGNADGAIQLWPAAGLGEADASSARASRAAP